MHLISNFSSVVPRQVNVTYQKKQMEGSNMICLYLFHFVILSQQSIRTVGNTHGDDAHGADHHHGNIHIREDCHDSSSYSGIIRKKKSRVTFEMFHLFCSFTVLGFLPMENPSVPRM